MPAKGLDAFIVTDYGRGVKKIAFDGTIIWEWITANAAKLSLVGGAIGAHSDSFGGDYLVAINGATKEVAELRDTDGAIMWRCPPLGPPARNVFWTLRPHSAFRLGAAELEGNLTVIGHEAGGGIVAVDKECRPRWGIMKPYMRAFVEYRPTVHNLLETTHVFPTPRGTIGACDCSGRWSFRVIEILKFPVKQCLMFLLAWDLGTTDAWDYLDPPLEVAEWDRILIQVMNIGANSLDWEVWSTSMPYIGAVAEFPGLFILEHSETVAAGAVGSFELTKPRTALRIRVKSTTAGYPTTYKMPVLLQRG